MTNAQGAGDKPTQLSSETDQKTHQQATPLVVMLDADGQIVSTNTAFDAFVDCRSDVLEGRLLWRLLADVPATDRLRKIFESTEEHPLPSTLRLRWKERGDSEEFSWSTASLEDPQRDETYIVLTGMIPAGSEQHPDRLPEGSTRTERSTMLESLAANIVHEIKNPLNAAGLQLEVLRRRLESVPETEHALDRTELIQDELRRVSSLLEEFLNFAKPGALNFSSVDLHRLTDEVLQLCKPEAEKKDVTLTLAPSSGPMPAFVDAERIRQVLLNLVQNAIHAVAEAGHVEIELEERDEHLVVRVKDDGPGLDDDVERLFEPFFTTKEGGTGLGLAISRRIIDEHAGRIRAVTEGEQTIFEAHLPAERRHIL